MRKKTNPLVTKTIKNFKNFNQTKFKNDIEYVPWSVCEIFDDIEDQVWAWECLPENCIGSHIYETSEDESKQTSVDK